MTAASACTEGGLGRGPLFACKRRRWLQGKVRKSRIIHRRPTWGSGLWGGGVGGKLVVFMTALLRETDAVRQGRSSSGAIATRSVRLASFSPLTTDRPLVSHWDFGTGFLLSSWHRVSRHGCVVARRLSLPCRPLRRLQLLLGVSSLPHPEDVACPRIAAL